MITINLNNIEQIILLNKTVRNQLKDLQHIFASWDLAFRTPGLTNLRKSSCMDLLNSLNQSHIFVLSNIFKDNTIVINRINYKIIDNLEVSALENSEFDNKFLNFCVTRNENVAKITFWR